MNILECHKNSRSIALFSWPALALLLYLVGVSPAVSATYEVLNLDDSGPGSLRAAITAANATTDDDLIVFDEGLNGTIVLTSGELSIGPAGGGLHIDGAERITISGNDTSTVFFINTGGDVRLEGLTLTDGASSAVEIAPSSNVTLERLLITDSLNSGGGGGILAILATLTINDSTITRNAASFGGGIFNDESQITLNNTTVSENSATDAGGAGILNGLRSLLILNNATLHSNVTDGPGGALMDQGESLISNSTLSGNSANFGGGIYRAGVGTTTLHNAIVADNTGSSDCTTVSGTLDARYSLIGDDLDCVNGINENNLTGDPRLDTLTGNPAYFPLLADSPALDAGSNALVPTGIILDQAGAPRISNSIVDMGAVERQVLRAIPTLGYGALGVLALLLAWIGLRARRI